MARRLTIAGRPEDGPLLRVGLIGCGSHAFRNIHPALHFLPVEIVATADIDEERAKLFARRYGAARYFTDYRRMLAECELAAVVLVLNYDERGRPRYPAVAADCLRAGCHVWMEKPPAARSEELIELEELARGAKRQVMIGFKKIFFPANVKAMELSRREEFGALASVVVRYPQHVPPVEALRSYLNGAPVGECVGFLDHLCHPVSLLLAIAGQPASLYYTRAHNSAATAIFEYTAGHIATLLLTAGQSGEGALESTLIVGSDGWHVEVQNNLRIYYYGNRGPDRGYGVSPSYYVKDPGDAPSFWEPEFSLGQLHNKGLFLLGYFGELEHFVACALCDQPVTRGDLAMGIAATRVFEAFAEGPNRRIPLV